MFSNIFAEMIVWITRYTLGSKGNFILLYLQFYTQEILVRIFTPDPEVAADERVEKRDWVRRPAVYTH